MSGYSGAMLQPRWATVGASMVAAVLATLLGADPATAAPAVGQIVAMEVAAAEEVDSLEARADNFDRTVPAGEQQALAEELTAAAWEPVPGPSEAPEAPLPEATSPPVADAPGEEGSTEPVEDTPVETTAASSPALQSLADPADDAESAGAEDGSELTTIDIAGGRQKVTTGGVAVTVTPHAGQDRGTIGIAAQQVGPEQDVPSVLLRVDPSHAPSGTSAGKGGKTDGESKGRAASGQDAEEEGAESSASQDEEAQVPPPAAVDLEISYAELAGGLAEDEQLPGGDWASRLTLVELSGCDATSSDCSMVPVSGAVNDVDSESVSAPVDLAGGEQVTLMMTASASGGSGDWGATSLAPSASWGVGGNTGALSWSYPLKTPQVTGPGPELGLSYNSAASDGRVASTNNQTGVVGEGWSLTESYIERTFVPCADDQEGSANNATHTTGDMCVGEDNATMVLNGSAVDLVKTSAGWVPKRVDGTRVERKAGADNGDNDGEYWVVTTSEGTKYTFGRGKRIADSLATGSSWTMPVYGNHSGEDGYTAPADGGFAKSKRNQTYRWMLEYVEEPTGGTMTYVYSKETRKYTYNLDEGVAAYTAGGYLSRILYGTRAGAETGAAPVRVDLEHTTRCVPGSGVNCDAGRVKQNLAAWPDVPGDLICYKTATSCGLDAISPSFYTLYRLDRVVTRVHDGSSYKPVDSWKLNQSFVSPGDGSLGDGSGKVMWLASIRHTGHGGTTATTDDLSNNPVKFGREMLANRIDRTDDGLPPMYRPRMTGIRTESGGVITPTYRTECGPGDVPGSTDTALSGNARLCFPVDWQGDNLPMDWFHKYVVTTVVQNGASVTGGNEIVTGSGELVTKYAYSDGAKWVKPTGPLTKKDEVTWSEFRGYRTVVTTEGEGSQASSTTTRYLRGLDSGVTFTVGPEGHRSTVTDHEAHSGTAVEQITHKGGASAGAASWSVTVPKVPAETAHNGTKVTRQIGATTYGYEMNAAGSVATRTQSATSNDTNGQVNLAEDLGDASNATDNTCTQITYAHTTDTALADKNMLGLVSRAQTYATTCAKVTAGEVSRPADVISDQVTTYNTAGLATSVRGLDPKLERDTATVGNGSGAGYLTTQTMAYDGYGRVTSVKDVTGAETSTVYTPASAVIPMTVTTTTPDPDGAGPKDRMTSSATFNKVTGLMVSSADANGKATRGAYDSLGRLLTVTYPEHVGLSKPSVAYEYTTRTNGLNVVVTRTLGADSDNKPVQHATAEFHDGLMRVFQTQDEVLDTGELRQDDPATRGRLITQVFYDTAGRVWKESGTQYASGVVSNKPVQPKLVAPSATVYSYDGAGRMVDQIFYAGVEDNHLYEKSRTVTRYDAPYTTVVPPDGGTATTTVTDGRGRTTALWEHKERPTVSSDMADGHWYVPSTLPGFNPRELATPTYQATTYAFNPFGQLESMANPADKTWSYGYDFGGRQVRATDPDAGTTTTEYDDAGQVYRTVNGNGNATGATIAVKNANTLVYSYDNLGRPTKVADGTAAVRSSWAYDVTPGPGGTPALGLPSSSTRFHDGEAYTTKVGAYDAAYRPTSTTMVLPDELPGLTGLVERQFTTSYEYRIDGSVRQQVLPGVTATDDDTTTPDASVLGAEHVTTFYDDAGLPVWMGGGFGWGTYVADSQFTAEGKPLAMDLGNTYGAVVTYDWDYASGRLNGIGLDRERFSGKDVDINYRYDAAGNVVSISNKPAVGDGTDNARANDDNQCFDLDGLGRLVGAWTDVDGDCDAAIGDVTPADVGAPDNSAAPYWQAYTYDAVGNRRSLTEHVLDGGTNVVRTNYQHAGGGAGPHQVTAMTQQRGPAATIDTAPHKTVAGFTYDEAGNQTTRSFSDPVDASDPTQVEDDTDGDGVVETSQVLGWDGEGELATVATTGDGTEGENTTEGGEASYVYSADGDRITRTDASGTTVYLPGGQEVHVDSAGAVAALRYYSFAGQTVAVRDGRGLGGVTSLVCDQQGTPVAAVPNTVWTADSVTHLYSDPFGGDRTPSTTDPDTGEELTGADRLPGDRRFLGAAGGVEDVGTGLVLLGARYYDPVMGRFLSVDPQLDPGAPAQFNAYVYSGNNPITYSDPSGLSWFSSIGNGLKKAGSAVGGFVKKHQAAIIGGAAGVVVFAGCMAITAGAGSIGCAVAAGAVGGAVSNLWRTKVQKTEPFTWKGFLTETAIGAASGAIGGGALGAIASRIAPTATAAASGAIRSVTAAASQRASSAAQAMASAVARSKASSAAAAARQRISSAVSGLKQRISGSGCSFAGSTGVLMADGTVKPIDQVEPGDEVLATDPETGEKEAKRVEATHGHDDVMLTLVLTTETGEKREVVTTEDHPFWSETDQEFQRADQLSSGELVLTAGGGTMEVHAILTEEVTYGPAWNLTVQGLHTYSVIAAGADVGAGTTRGPPVTDVPQSGAVLVHNCNLLQQRVDSLAGTMDRFTRSKNTLAIIQATDGNEVYNVLGWSGSRGLRSEVRAALSGERVADALPGADAEVTALEFIRARGWTPLSGATSRPVCPWCQNALLDRGATFTGPERRTAIKTATGWIRRGQDGKALTGWTQFQW